jgi:hypothetical protein
MRDKELCLEVSRQIEEAAEKITKRFKAILILNDMWKLIDRCGECVEK